MSDGMDILKVKNEGYGEYEELLLERDALHKESFLWKQEYTRVFGDRILQVFEKKISCIKKKKTIAFCQVAKNRGESVDQAALRKYIDAEMKEYNKRLREMVDENDMANSVHTISRSTLEQIKKLYHKLAKALHPDINPQTEKIPELRRLWQMVSVAYTANSLKDLEDAEILVRRALEKIDMGDMEIEIPDIDKKIAEIREEILRMKEKNPYQYKFLLEDTAAVEKRKQELDAEYKEYEDYEKTLDAIMEELMTSGVSMTWHLN